MTDQASQKAALRKQLRTVRREQSAAIPANVAALILKQPPAPLLDMIPDDAIIGLYHATAFEVPAKGYAKHFSERGHAVALPRFESPDAAMGFAAHTDPFGESDLETGPFGIMQPSTHATELVPQIVFVPLLGFTLSGDRLGQGGGHYDRWLAAHSGAIAIGLAWDGQLVDTIPTEAHDAPLSAVVTPTRLYGPF